METMTNVAIGRQPEFAQSAQQSAVSLLNDVQMDIEQYEAAIKLLKSYKTWKFSLESFLGTLLENPKVLEAVEAVFNGKEKLLQDNRNQAIAAYIIDIAKYLEISYIENLEYYAEVERSIGGGL